MNKGIKLLDKMCDDTQFTFDIQFMNADKCENKDSIIKNGTEGWFEIFVNDYR